MVKGAWAWSCDELLGDQAMNEVMIQHAGLTLRIDRLVYLAQDRGAIGAGWWVID